MDGKSSFAAQPGDTILLGLRIRRKIMPERMNQPPERPNGEEATP